MSDLKNKFLDVVAVIKAGLLYVVLPVTALFGYIYWLSRKNQTLADELEMTKSGNELAGKLAKKEEAKNEADRIEKEYRDAVDAYYTEYGQLSTDSNTKPKRTGGSEGRQD